MGSGGGELWGLEIGNEVGLIIWIIENYSLGLWEVRE